MLPLIDNELLVCTIKFCIQELWTSLLPTRPLEKLSLHSLYYKRNPQSSSALHTHRHPQELASRGGVEITFLNATTKGGRCKWLFRLLLVFCSSAFGCCIQGRLGRNAAWSTTNNPDDAGGGTEVHLQWTRQNEARDFCRHLGGCSLAATLTASSLIIASPEQDWIVLVFPFVPGQSTYLELWDFLPLSP